MTDRELISHKFGQSDSDFESLDLAKLWMITLKSWIWVALFFVLSVGTSFIIVRYTKPLYESQSIIKLNFKNEANSLGLITTSGVQSDLNDISGEIEILMSDLFLEKVIDELEYHVAYYRYGVYLNDERYGNSPFEVSFNVKNPSFYDQPFDVELTGDKSFTLMLNNGETNTYNFGQDITTENFNLRIDKTEHLSETSYGRYFFLINSRGNLLSYLRGNLTVLPENFNAKTIKLSLKDHNRYKAKFIVDVASRMYLLYTTDSKNKALDQKIEFLQDRVMETKEKLSELEAYFENFIIKNRTVSLDNDLARTIVILHSLDSQRYNMQLHYDAMLLLQDQLNADLNSLNPFLISRLPDFIQETVLEYQELAINREKKLNVYNENTRAIKQLDDQLLAARNSLNEVMTQYLKSISKDLKDLNLRKAQLEGSFVQLPAMGTEYDKNRRLYQIYEEFAITLRQSQLELEITKAGTVAESLILSPGALPEVPIKPQVILVYGAGSVLAIVMSLLFILIRYATHNRITSAAELERLTSVPLIGVTPFYNTEKLLTTRLIIDTNSKSAISESLRAIRTNMEFIRPASETKLLTITSTISGEGKTFIAVNLGAIIASSGQKVCIVDLDMRKPKVHLALGHEASVKGVSTVLSKRSVLSECIMPTDVLNMSYLPAGPTPPNPSELILSEEFKELIKELKKEFDLIIMDTPPVGLVTDGVLAMKQSDMQIYVLKADYSRRQFTRTIQDLQRINKFHNMCLLLNGLKSSHVGYGSSYGHGYGYDYGSGYYDDDKSNKSSFFKR